MALTKESFLEQLSRVHEMSEDSGDTWDLSPNDQAALTALIVSHADLLAVLKRVLAGFEANAFCRNTDGDGDPGWAFKFFPHLKALADATVAIAKAEG